MSLFGNSIKTGAGIAKDAPKKKPFFQYWEIAFRKFWKIIDINMLMALGFLPLVIAGLVIYYFAENYAKPALLLAGGLVILFAVCFGPLLAGCTQVLRNFAREKPIFLLDTFFKAFKNNFKQACLVGIIDLIMIISVASSFYVYPKMIQDDGSAIYYILFVSTLSIAIAVTMMSFYAYLMIVSTDLSMKNVLKNSLALSFIALKQNLITLLIAILVMGIFGILTYLFPYILAIFWLFIPTGFVAFMIVFNCYPVIQKFVINPYYTQKGEINPELTASNTSGENIFEDRGGSEKPTEIINTKENESKNNKTPRKKGKVIS
ncbi:MAG: DUF624 domain-containing protein [Oscillospiraceae bacterium]|nr:DUF624 domain-containing protein [Oscillospiraceae bacterium]